MLEPACRSGGPVALVWQDWAIYDDRTAAQEVVAAVDGYVPPASGSWETTSPDECGWNAPALERVAAFAAQRKTTALVFVHRGRILFERYFENRQEHSTLDVASAQKSITSILVGIAADRGLLDINAPSAELLGTLWSGLPGDAERKITLRHHLSMTTGLSEKLSLEAEPGTAWRYNNRTYHIIKNGLERVTGLAIDDFSREVLWAPLGMADTRWEPRVAPPGQPRNVFAFGPADAPFSALLSSGRDMARFGLLVLRGISWGGTSLVRDTAYLDAALKPSQDLNPSYGHLWWLNGQSAVMRPIAGPRIDGWLIPKGPRDLVCALGAGDQKVYVVPSLDLVVVRLGGAAGEVSAAGSSFDSELWSLISEAAPQGR